MNGIILYSLDNYYVPGELLNAFHKPLRLSSFYRWGNWGSESLKKILKTKLLINGRIGTWTQFCLKSFSPSHLVSLSGCLCTVVKVIHCITLKSTIHTVVHTNCIPQSCGVHSLHKCSWWPWALIYSLIPKYSLEHVLSLGLNDRTM